MRQYSSGSLYGNTLNNFESPGPMTRVDVEHNHDATGPVVVVANNGGP